MMKHVYLKINNQLLPTPDDFDLKTKDIEGASSGMTEAGITHRDIIRQGVVSIALKFTLSSQRLVEVSKLVKDALLTIIYMDPYTLEEKEIQGYCTDFQVQLLKNTNHYGLWLVSFTLEEY